MMSSASHKITEWFGLKGALEIILFHSLCHGGGHLPLDQVAPGPVQSGHGHFQGWALTLKYKPEVAKLRLQI